MNMEMVALAERWADSRPFDHTSVFACRFPGRYKQAAEAASFVKRMTNHIEESGVALSDKELAKLYLAEKNAMRRDVHKMVELVAYYRELVPDITRVKPPPHYFIIHAKNWSFGRVEDGFLKMLGKECGSEEAAVEACWTHYDDHISPKVRKFMEDKPAPAKKPQKKEEPAVDLSLDDDDDEEPEQPTRRRRRRVVND